MIFLLPWSFLWYFSFVLFSFTNMKEKNSNTLGLCDRKSMENYMLCVVGGVEDFFHRGRALYLLRVVKAFASRIITTFVYGIHSVMIFTHYSLKSLLRHCRKRREILCFSHELCLTFGIDDWRWRRGKRQKKMSWAVLANCQITSATL
jgi:hypothetical protein